ncbi:MAG TPA: cyclopropane-fatty-acyl-phospholipid synthase family protein [Pseudonocardia sp.]|jgi:cyclopropane-fatty-acyl-phospholipid synthase|uniref:cyclopropane-fatty-acyl-phospholipid synthase family protein n=1 Tax=Pseudonocardia sp. TaxID=60912 RepID=UPI002B4B942F|nr:cyclopropane-fatty-acyl-phospholipid synthase family protein [Pseudonocardia sp.]HLU59975.1 cyclopropane-fatty-acyl-phospholipid synthase family protein [Pseudonocardia sp.]
MQVAQLISDVLGQDVPVRVVAYDGSKAGPDGSDVALKIVTPRALARLVTAPGTLGLARAYVTGEIEVDGDVYDVLDAMADLTLNDISRADRLRLVRTLFPLWLRHRQPIPELEYRPRGRLHSKRRDSKAISHHYDVSNRFYEWVLGPSMAYTCAVYPTKDATLEEAQTAKHELVAQKLALRPGMRLLDVGCGWGGMVMHAAAEHGVKALGVTLSRNQAEWAQAEIERRGLSHLAEVRHLDYRDAPDEHFDAISSIGLTEHIGKDNLPGYFAALHRRLKPEGRLLNHSITQPYTPRKRKTDPFITRYVFPDGQLEPVGHIISVMNDAGFEIRHEENLREHYARTLAAWCDNLEEHWTEAVAEVGLGRARVWRLYMAASRLGFERDNIQLHQVLGVKLGDRGRSGFPLRGWS